MTTSAAPGPTPPPAGEPRTSVAAFFDLDGTLIPGSANIPLAKTAFRAGMVGKRELLRDLRNGASFLLSGASDARSAQVRDRILMAVKGHPASQVEALGDVFLPDLVASLRPQLEPVLAEHAARGEDQIVLSASPTEIVARFADGAGLTYGRGTTAGRDADGVYDGTLLLVTHDRRMLDNVRLEQTWQVAGGSVFVRG